jgi:TnpA family transposase
MAKRYNIVSRIIAATALVFVYMVSVVGTSGLFLAASTSSAEAQRGRGRGRGFARGVVRGRGYGRGRGIYVAPRARGGCYYSRRFGRVVCY